MSVPSGGADRRRTSAVDYYSLSLPTSQPSYKKLVLDVDRRTVTLAFCGLPGILAAPASAPGQEKVGAWCGARAASEARPHDTVPNAQTARPLAVSGATVYEVPGWRGHLHVAATLRFGSAVRNVQVVAGARRTVDVSRPGSGRGNLYGQETRGDRLNRRSRSRPRPRVAGRASRTRGLAATSPASPAKPGPGQARLPSGVFPRAIGRATSGSEGGGRDLLDESSFFPLFTPP